MRDVKIYGELTLKFGNDYEVKLILNTESEKDYVKEELLENYPLVGCEWIFKDGLSNVTQNWYGTARFSGDSFLKHMYKIAQKKLRLEKEDNLFNPVLAALAGKRQLESILGNKYWQDHCQSGGLVVEMTASNGKVVRCKYQDILLRNPVISIDGGEYIEVWIAKMFMNPSEKRGQHIECNNLFGKLVYNIIKDIDSFSFLLDIMEECAGLEIEK